MRIIWNKTVHVDVETQTTENKYNRTFYSLSFSNR